MKQSMLDDPWAPLVQQMVGFLDPSEVIKQFGAVAPVQAAEVANTGVVIAAVSSGKNGEEIDIDDDNGDGDGGATRECADVEEVGHGREATNGGEQG